MSKDSSSIRFTSRNSTRIAASEANENEFEDFSNIPVSFPPPRTPLNSIPDPSQYLEQKLNQELDHEASMSARSSDAKLETSVPHQMMTVSKKSGNVNNHDNSRVWSRWKSHSEPNSANSTPARRISNIGAVGTNTGPRVSLHGGEKVGGLSKVSKRLSVENIEVPSEITKFELEEDPSFWNDHNVQVCF